MQCLGKNCESDSRNGFVTWNKTMVGIDQENNMHNVLTTNTTKQLPELHKIAMFCRRNVFQVNITQLNFV